MGRVEELSAELALLGYTLHEEIGSGTFSVVYKAVHVDAPQVDLALKVVHPTVKPERIANELHHLHASRGHGNVVECLDAFSLSPKAGGFVFVFPQFQHTGFLDMVTSFSLGDVRAFARSLFAALAHIHAKGIIHRDVKPRNFLYSPEDQAGLLLDFGLAQTTASSIVAPSSKRLRLRRGGAAASVPAHVAPKPAPRQAAATRKRTRPPGRAGSHYPATPGLPLTALAKPKQRADRAGTPGFRAPEVLMCVQEQSTALDVWSAGVMLCMLLARRYPLFYTAKGGDMHSLTQIMNLLGVEPVLEAAHRCGKAITEHPLDAGEGPKLRELVMRERAKEPGWEAALDLVVECLQADAGARITAAAALESLFLAPE